MQLAHFDGLDPKAGLVLGFAGVLIALGNGSGSLAGIVSTTLAAFAAVASVASFWPRKFASIDPTRLGDYASAELAFTQLTVLDTLEVMLVETTEKLELKTLRLKSALTSLTASCPGGIRPIVGMTEMPDTPQTHKKQPPPRPPRQPDPKLITYLERGKEDGDESQEPGRDTRQS